LQAKNEKVRFWLALCLETNELINVCQKVHEAAKNVKKISLHFLGEVLYSVALQYKLFLQFLGGKNEESS